MTTTEKTKDTATAGQDKDEEAAAAASEERKVARRMRKVKLPGEQFDGATTS
jgi:hypothetical protein